MNLKITSEGIDIIGSGKDVVLYRTVDENIVIFANSIDYKEVFNGSSCDLVERMLYNDLYTLMKKMSNKYDQIHNFYDNCFSSAIRFYGNDVDNLLKLEKNGENILFEVKKLTNNGVYNSGRIEIDGFNDYSEIFLDFFNSLLKDASSLKKAPIQKVYKM